MQSGALAACSAESGEFPEVWLDGDPWIFHLGVCVCVCISCSVVSDSLQPQGLQPSRLLCPWDSPGKNTGVGCHSLLQGIFLTGD